jgi:Na+-transporting methylmalonyl-CoA/oxaloacetate decarboxylase gamma subunit
MFITLVLLALVGATLVPDVQEFHFHATVAALVLAVLLLVIILLTPVGRTAAPEPEPERAKAEAVTPAAAPPPVNQAEAEIVSFLATLQDKGRLVDFLMDDVSAYGDAEVGAAARVVHEGCRAVLHEHFDIEPIRTEREGATITVPENYRADAYRLVGKISGEPPFTGHLVHRGWKTETVKLPRVLRSGDDRLPAIAPAEVEVR